MTPRTKLTPLHLVDALNLGSGLSAGEDVRAAAEAFEVSERTVYRYINEFGIRQRCTWELPEGGQEAA